MTLVEFYRFSRANLWRLLAVTVLGFGLGHLYGSSLPKVYAADSSGWVVGATPEGSDPAVGSTAAAIKAESFVGLVGSRAVGELTMKKTGINTSPADLAGRVSAVVVPNTAIIKVSAVGPTPEEAQRVADAVISATAEVANRLELGGEVKPGQKAVVRIIPVESALPGGLIAPNVRRYELMGLVAGLGLGYAFLLLRRYLDTRIRSVKDVEEYAHTGVLGVVPVTPELRAKLGRGRVGRLGVAAEAFRQLRTNLRFVRVDSPPRSVVVTSANAGEGKSTVSSTLARVLGEAGQPTVIIDADLRRPTLSAVFETSGSVGLSQLLANQVTIDEALQDTDQENVKLIAAGRTPPNPSELLGSQRMHALIDQLTRTHLVILDAPPLLPVTDAGLLAAMTDGALLVLAVGKTHKEQARLCAKVLDQVGGRLLGAVLNLAPRKGMGSVVYGDGYASKAYTSDYYTQEKYVGKRGAKRSLRIGRSADDGQ